MSAQKIRADYEQLAQIASVFGQQAETAQRVLGALQNDINTLQGGDWVGQGAETFYREMNSAVLPAVTRVVAAMNEAANTTTKISRIMKQAEEEAARILRAEGTGGAAAGMAGAEATAGRGGGRGAAISGLFGGDGGSARGSVVEALAGAPGGSLTPGEIRAFAARGKPVLSEEKTQALNALADLLTGKNLGGSWSAEDVARLMRHDFTHNPKELAAAVQQLLASDNPRWQAAGRNAMNGLYDLLKRNPKTGLSSTQINFITAAAELSGPGSERVKGELALVLNTNILRAENAGWDSELQDYGNLLGKLVQSDPVGVVGYLEDHEAWNRQVPDVFGNLLKYSDKGRQIVGDVVGRMIVDTARKVAANPEETFTEQMGYRTGQLLAHVETAVRDYTNGEVEAIKYGGNILRYSIKAVELLSRQSIPLSSAVDKLEKYEVKDVTEGMKVYREGMYEMVQGRFSDEFMVWLQAGRDETLGTSPFSTRYGQRATRVDTR